MRRGRIWHAVDDECRRANVELNEAVARKVLMGTKGFASPLGNGQKCLATNVDHAE